jgi:membrane protein
MATVMWFVTTLLFGWYVTRFANYSEVYGSLGTGIALLFWLYIISLSVLCGAEFNAQLDIQRAMELKGTAVPASEPTQITE